MLFQFAECPHCGKRIQMRVTIGEHGIAARANVQLVKAGSDPLPAPRASCPKRLVGFLVFMTVVGLAVTPFDPIHGLITALVCGCLAWANYRKRIK